MSYITSEQLTQYDSNIKSYIENKISNAVKGYSLSIVQLEDKVSQLNTIIEEQNETINKLQNTIDEFNNKDDIIGENTIIPTPMLRSLSKGGNMDDNNGLEINNVGDVPIVRSIQPEQIVVQEDVDENYIVYDREITPNEQAVYNNIVVTTDNKSNRVWFSMWKTFDDIELVDKEINIIWVNALGYKGESLCVGKQVSGNRLYFAWNIPGTATVKAGPITYAIRIVDTDYAWHTLPAVIECVQGLKDDGWDDLPDAQITPGWVDYIEGKYKMYFVKLTKVEYERMPEHDDDCVYVVEDELTGDIGMYCGDLPISGGGSSDASAIHISRADYDDLVENEQVDDDKLYMVEELDNSITLYCGLIAIETGGGGGASIVKLTSAQYEALREAGQIDENTLYIIKG